ncbi:TonB-linked outer membrane protein, SusC/RagA family [Pedobacter sp. ok626]|nr:TonB-linked outer membrane protein, SusC/RagA family [Pedobacter sp. ok626]
MNFYKQSVCKPPGLIHKFLLIMKLTAVLMITAFLQFAQAGKAQRITFSQRNVSLEEVFKEIRKQSGYDFFYDVEDIKKAKRVDLSAKNETIEEVLNRCFKGQPFTYLLKESTVIVKEKIASDLGNNMEDLRKIDIKGKITDGNGIGLPGVSVKLKGTSTGVVSDKNGNYALYVPDNNGILVFSYIGFSSQEIPIGDKTIINVKLAEENANLSEVVVVGYGTQKKVNLTGSVATVAADELIKRPAANASLLLQGKVPGLQIIQNSAQPGLESPSIQIHGVGTFGASGNNPLVLIDGVEGSLSNVNPNMIENISVLKDAASAAIYGVQGANGVILVTTKMGVKGRLNIEYAYNYGVQKPAGVPDLIWNSAEFMELSNEGINRTGQNAGKLYSQVQIDAYKNGNGSAQFPNTNWADLMFKDASMQQHFLSVNGGEGKTTYNFGLGYLDQKGILFNTGYKKYNASLNFKTQMGKVVTFGSNFSFMQGDRRDPVDNSENLVLSIYAQHPLWSPYLPDGSGRVVSKAYDFETTNQNAYAVMNTSKDLNKEYGISAISYLNFNIAKGLVAEIRGAVRYNTDRQTASRIPLPTFLFQPDAAGVYKPQQNYLGTFITLRKTQQEFMNYTAYSTLTYDETFNNVHHFSAVAGYNMENHTYQQQAGFRRDFPSPDLSDLNAGGNDAQTANGYSYEWALQSGFGRVNYAYDNRYLFEATLRYDGSSRFHKGKRWGTFPALSAGWRVSQEAFMKDKEWLSNLKIRGSWGQLGNQNIANYPYQNLLDYGTYIYDGVTTGIVSQNLSDPNITWETTTAAGFGLDFDLFKGKLSGTFDYFDKRTKDILRVAQLPDFIGMGAPTVNSGAMKNTGFEFTLSHKNKIGNVTYELGANFYTYKNVVTKFGPDEIQGNKIRREGLAWNSWYMLDWIGVFQNQAEIDAAPKHQNSPKPGDLRFADHSGPNGVPDGKIDPFDRVVIKGQHPDFNYGFNLNLGYKGFDLSAFFLGVAGRKVYTTDWGYGAFRQWSPPPTFWRDRWTPENPTNKLPGMYVDTYAPITAASSFWLQDASYLRLKNLVVGYTFQNELIKKIGLQNLRLYFSGDNLFTITDFVGDPERVILDNTSGRFAIYPQANVYTVGIKTTF